MTGKARARVMLDVDNIERSPKCIAHEILERNKGAGNLVLLEAPTRGAPPVRRLRDTSREARNVEVPAGSLDITMYCDDLRSNPIRVPHPTGTPDDGVGATTVVLVDDVFYSNQTTRSALGTTVNIGRPATVQPAVLMDRRHRELSIYMDRTGKNPSISHTGGMRANLTPIGEADFVVIERA